MDAFESAPAVQVSETEEAASERLSAPSVAYLVARARHGDQSAKQQLFRRCLARSYAVALRILRRPEDAEDIVQDSFSAALSKLDSCREPARFEHWMLQIVRNRSRNLIGARRLREDHGWNLNEAVSPPRQEDAGLRDDLLRALQQIPTVQREIVLRHDLEGWTHREISDALGVTEVNSRQLLFQARGVLRQLLKEVSTEPARAA
jgi:RNA polymerase sigma-70 factor (ECF subfamily)